MKSPDQDNKISGWKHWLFQIIPPLSMFGILLAADKGPALVFLAGIFIIPVFVSLISIIVKLIFFKERKYYLIRPCLTITIFISILAIAHSAYKIALEQAVTSARVIHEQCNKNMHCPEHPEGWVVDGSMIKKSDFGFWLKYPASYYYGEQSFNIRVYQGPDLGDHIIGGVNVTFEVVPYQDGS